MQPFTYEYYKKLLRTCLDQGYTFSYFNDDKKINDVNQKIVILRHDVDFDPDKALEMSAIEQQMNIPSTYFFLLNSKFYNIHNTHVYHTIQNIQSNGHRLGIHFDEASYEESNTDLSQFIQKEIYFFQELFKQPIAVISFHRPTSNVLLNKINIPIAHTYSERYAQHMKYLSDSMKQFKEGDLIDIITSGKYQKIQLLIHPFWWNETVTTSTEDYNNYVTFKNKELQKEIANNSKIYVYEEDNDRR